MDIARRKLILDTLTKIEALAKKALDATHDDEEDDAIDDARNYLWRIVEQAEEAQGQWWA